MDISATSISVSNQYLDFIHEQGYINEKQGEINKRVYDIVSSMNEDIDRNFCDIKNEIKKIDDMKRIAIGLMITYSVIIAGVISYLVLI